MTGNRMPDARSKEVAANMAFYPPIRMTEF